MKTHKKQPKSSPRTLKPSQIILLNKPFNVLCQFSDDKGRATLKDWLANKPGFYPAGRLDYDSEGLVVLTKDGHLQNRISSPRFGLEKTYWVQLDGEITEQAIQILLQGVLLKDGLSRALRARRIAEPDNIWPRNPPVRFRAHIPTSWLEITINEGRNRQVKRTTAAVGFPTLRLIRVAVGPWQLQRLQPGEHLIVTASQSLL